MTKVGRPKKENLNSVIKVSVNEETAEVFEETAKVTGKSKSDLLREIIPTVSSKDFEGMISNTSMELLYKHSEECWNLVHTEECIFEVEKLSDKMPAFITTFGTPMIHVKYPTFKVQIFNGADPRKYTDQIELNKLFSGIENISDVYATKADFIMIGNKFERLEHPFVNEVMCLHIDLAKCVETKDKIVALLKENGYRYSVYPSYCLRADYIEMLEDGKYFRVFLNHEAE